MNKWRCRLCGYVYDPEEGDDDNDIQPDTPFDDLPTDWVCPDCGASREEFDELAPDE